MAWKSQDHDEHHPDPQDRDAAQEALQVQVRCTHRDNSQLYRVATTMARFGDLMEAPPMK